MAESFDVGAGTAQLDLEAVPGAEDAQALNGSAQTRVRGCVSHCVSCGLSFSGDRAFDRHRAGGPDERFCLEPEDVRDGRGESVFVGKPGRPCSLGWPGETRLVTVWALASSGDAAARFAA